MKLICGTRQSGRTTAAVKLVLADPDAVLVVATTEQGRLLERNEPAMAGRWLSLAQLQTRTSRDHRRRLVVDDLDLMLPELLGAPVVAVTLEAADFEVQI